MNKDVARWTRSCLTCQRTKVHRHTKTPLEIFTVPDRRFDHVHVDIVGPLPPSRGFSYLSLHPLAGGSALNQHVHRYCMSGVPVNVGSEIWNSDHRHHRPRPAVPERSVARTHHCAPYQVGTGVSISSTDQRYGGKVPSTLEDRPAHANHSHRWIDALPLVLLGIRSSVKEDLRHAPAELVYGSPLRLPGVFFTKTLPSNAQLSATTYGFFSTPFDRHRQEPHGRGNELKDCTRVFVRNEAPRPPLSPTYDVPYLVLSRAGKTITICCQNKTETISLDIVKPAFLDSGDAPHVRSMQVEVGMVPLGLNSIPIRAHCSFIGRCPRYFIIGR
ncbi:Pro-Pol polyprotein [Trichinella britovi]|uniref:Pro-Pol polyprotein n=1 Tax=Trichinella britovi TaxID=45882 RepID=A0A0V1C893_TRIBR|nr:Pro-Pol polyprotein [Trichinella britovi]